MALTVWWLSGAQRAVQLLPELRSEGEAGREGEGAAPAPPPASRAAQEGKGSVFGYEPAFGVNAAVFHRKLDWSILRPLLWGDTNFDMISGCVEIVQ